MIEMIKSKNFLGKVSDPHWFDADPYPAFFLIADQGLKDLLKYLFSFHEKKFQKGHFNK
jgi:hypothetical protein